MKCLNCGKEFSQTRQNHKFCSNSCGTCYRERQARSYKEYVPPPKSSKSLSEWAREAAECNLDYGSYRALIDAGKTFDELKSTAHLRTLSAHSKKSSIHTFKV